MIELSTRHEIDVLAGRQRLVRLDVSVRPDERNLHAWVGFFDFADEFDVALKTNGRSEQNEKFVVLADLHRLLPIYFVRGGVQKAASGNHSRGIRQPNRIPVRFDFTRRGPPRTCPAIKILKTRWIQQQCLHYIRHSSPSVSRILSWQHNRSRPTL